MTDLKREIRVVPSYKLRSPSDVTDLCIDWVQFKNAVKESIIEERIEQNINEDRGRLRRVVKEIDNMASSLAIISEDMRILQSFVKDFQNSMEYYNDTNERVYHEQWKDATERVISLRTGIDHVVGLLEDIKKGE